MKEEISVAVRFLSRLIEKNSSLNSTSNINSNNTSNGTPKVIDKEQLEVFKERLAVLLSERFQDHWFPDKPSRGQGYRCIRLNESDRKDTVIDRAASQCGISYEQLRLPAELTIWVDPKEVCCRFGEHQGSFCTLASFKNGSGEIFLDQVNFEEIHKKTMEQKEKVAQEMSTRKNGRRGFLNSGSSPNFKGNRPYSNGYSGHHHHNHHASSHHGGGHGGGQPHHSPSPAAMNWYNSMNTATTMEMFSSSPPNHYSSYSLAKFSPPKYGYGSPSKWSAPPPHPAYGPTIPSSKGDKYHWFNNKATIKA
ncbi:unnamed protein product [Orchesella dallaii]|uniref:Anti-proliferative protein domain-containing protein n=1 Tax=Orchesella dallaii TaxID=48710 RepID=A0ABP1QF14_9HEXA